VTVGIVIKDKEEPGDNYIQLKFSSQTESVKDAHWLQLMYRTKKVKDKEDNTGTYEVQRTNDKGVRYNVRYAFGEGGRHVDVTSGGSVFYDEKGLNDRPTDKELSIFDRPELGDVADDIAEETAIADAFLVADGKVYYHVHWERVLSPKGGGEYVNIKGEDLACKKLPQYLTKERLPGGFIPKSGTDCDFPNPLKRVARKANPRM
jgi:hypothetical protein